MANAESIIVATKYLTYALILILPIAYAGKYVYFEPKLPYITLLWMINNLIFVAYPEEVIFRGILQNFIKDNAGNLPISPRYISKQHIYIPALIFGLMHFHGGLFYVILCIIAGIFYGLTYDKTGRLSSSIYLHFWVNGLHFLFFTYPFVARM